MTLSCFNVKIDSLFNNLFKNVGITFNEKSDFTLLFDIYSKNLQ